MRILRSRRGDWIQIFMVFFFALILILSIALLSLDKGKLKNTREQLALDLQTQDANAQLISLMRSPASGGFEGDGRDAQIADIIVINGYNVTAKKGAYDGLLLESFGRAVPANLYFEIIMTYPDGSIHTVSNTKYDASYRYLLNTQGRKALDNELSNKAIGPEWRSQHAPDAFASAVLPAANGNVRIEYYISEKIGADAAVMRGERVVRE